VNRAMGVCIFCKNVIGLRKRTGLLLKHPIWVSGNFLTCPGSGGYATPLPPGPTPERDEER
jgi:hypothetical protein